MDRKMADPIVAPNKIVVKYTERGQAKCTKFNSVADYIQCKNLKLENILSRLQTD